MTADSAESEKPLVLYACDPLVDPANLDLDGSLLTPDRVRLLVAIACEVPQESLAWFRKRLMPPAQLRRQVAAREVELQERMFAVSKYLEHLGYDVDTRIERGKHTGDIILRIADEANVDLIVMKRRDQSPWERLLIGSVVDYVAKRARQPLLILPPGSPPVSQPEVPVPGAEKADRE